jgi:hypothetical protein
MVEALTVLRKVYNEPNASDRHYDMFQSSKHSVFIIIAIIRFKKKEK